jgi:hypothetical protein
MIAMTPRLAISTANAGISFDFAAIWTWASMIPMVA